MEPKKESLKAAESVLQDQAGKLKEKQAELEVVRKELRALNKNLDNKQTEKKVTLHWPATELHCY